MWWNIGSAPKGPLLPGENPCTTLVKLNILSTKWSSGAQFKRTKPETIYTGNMVELQVAFQAIRVRRDEYIFLPILRAVCLLSREVEQVSHIILWYAN